MNRRNFFKTLATVAAGFSILPAATTYARAPWRKAMGSGIYILNPEWKNAPYEWVWRGLDGAIGASLRESMLPVRFRMLPMTEENLVHPYIEL